MAIDPTKPADNALISTLPAYIREARAEVSSIVEFENTYTDEVMADHIAAGDPHVQYELRNSNIQSHIASTGNPHSVTANQVGLGNVTNESKAVMFTSPTFTGHPVIEGVTSTGATGTGKLVFDTSPTLVAPALGTPSSGTVTNLTGTASININGTVGATTPSTGAFTTISTNSITFPSTQSASSNANTLDDYEEGAWTPTITFDTVGDLSVSYSIQIGTYTKVGRLVTVTFNIITSAFTHTTASGNLRIPTLPFTPSTTYQALGSILFQGITKTNYTNYAVSTLTNNTYLIIEASGSGHSVSIVGASNLPTGGTIVLYGTMTYEV